jgi:hypothetical protein
MPKSTFAQLTFRNAEQFFNFKKDTALNPEKMV